MKYVKIFTPEKNGFFRQDAMGYEESEHEAGFFTEEEASKLNINESVLVPFEPSKLQISMKEKGLI